MPSLQRIDRPVANLGEFINEIAEGLTALFGPSAGDEYRRIAPKQLEAVIAEHSIDAIALMDGPKAAGILLATTQGELGRITFIHVLSHYAGIGVERQLVNEAVRTLRGGGVEEIVCDYVPSGPLALDAVFASLGFRSVARVLMMAGIDDMDGMTDGPAMSRPCTPADWADISELIAETYREHPDRELLVEVREPCEALRFLVSVTRGNYGPTEAEFGRLIEDESDVAGVIVGCRIAPEVGFVLQVAVRPGAQGQGLGTQLLRDEARAFRDAGLSSIALGVTASSPARQLYERLGFRTLREVQAYVWKNEAAGHFRF